MTAPVSIDQSEASITKYIDHSGDGLVGGAGGGPAVHCKHHRHGAILCRDETNNKKEKVSNKRKEEEEEKQDVEILTIML